MPTRHERMSTIPNCIFLYNLINNFLDVIASVWISCVCVSVPLSHSSFCFCFYFSHCVFHSSAHQLFWIVADVPLSSAVKKWQKKNQLNTEGHEPGAQFPALSMAVQLPQQWKQRSGRVKIGEFPSEIWWPPSRLSLGPALILSPRGLLQLCKAVFPGVSYLPASPAVLCHLPGPRQNYPTLLANRTQVWRW